MAASGTGMDLRQDLYRTIGASDNDITENQFLEETRKVAVPHQNQLVNVVMNMLQDTDEGASGTSLQKFRARLR